MSKIMSKSRCISMVTPGFIEDIDTNLITESRNVRNKELVDDELASSIKKIGLLQPILVRSIASNFEIVAGNRRFRACKILGWKKIACHIIELDDRQTFEVSLVENIQRKMLSPLDEAIAFKAYVSDFGWGGVSDLASRIGKSASNCLIFLQKC